MTLTAYAPLHKLVDELGRLGWGDLAGREWGAVRALLRALVAHDGINNFTGAGTATVPQLARHAGISQRWATDRLGVLEAGGFLEGDRGYLDPNQNGVPSRWRVNKEAIFELLATAREIRDAAQRAMWVAARARMAKLHSLRALYLNRHRARRDRYMRRSLRGEVSARLSPLPGEERPAPARPPGSRPWDNLETCSHGGIVGRCPSCRRNGTGCAGAQTMEVRA